MRKLYFALILLMGLFVSNVQAEEGVVDLSGLVLTDINGVVYDIDALQADGITIIFDFWATWCGPCIASIPGLDDIWAAHGPDGDNTIYVFSVETDASTSNEQSVIASEGITNPVFIGEDNTGISPTFFAYGGGIPYFTVVCPSGYWQDRTGGIGANAGLLTSLAGACTNVAEDDAFSFKLDADLTSCPSNATTEWELDDFEFANIGSETITSAIIEVKIDGIVDEIIEWTGSLAPANATTVAISPITFYGMGSQLVEVDVVQVNGNDDATPANNLRAFNRGTYIATETALTFEITTDNYPDEITFEIRNSSNAVVASGGPYDGQTNTVVTENVTLADLNDCHTIRFLDSYGDGVPGGGFELKQGNTVVVSNFKSFDNTLLDNFLLSGDSDNDGFADAVEVLAGTDPNDGSSVPAGDLQDLLDTDNDGFSDDVEVAQGSDVNNANSTPYDKGSSIKDAATVLSFNVFPNPATDVLNIAIESTVETLNVELIDVLGRVIVESTMEAGKAELNTERLNSGLYIVNIENNGVSVATSTVIIK